MQYRRFGRTELAMPVFSCGGMRYQQAWKDLPEAEITAEAQANLEATIERALELGITHVETARGYGSSEQQLGRILPRLPRERLIVQTKVSPREDAREFRETCEKSLDLLGLDYVDLLAFHGVNTAGLLDQVLRKGGCLEAARELQREGRVRHLGFSTHGACALIEATIRSGEFDYVNLYWYWINQTNWPAIEVAAREDMGVFIISPSDKGGRLYDPPDKLVELCSPLDPMEFNDLFCLLRPEVHTLSIGAARPGDFDTHVRALERWDEAVELVSGIEGRLVGEMGRVLGADWVAGWEEGLPVWDAVPGGVNVRDILRWDNLARGLGLGTFAKERYNMLGGGGHWVPGENAAVFDEAAVVAAVAGNAFAGEIPERLRAAHASLYEAPKKRLSEG